MSPSKIFKAASDLLQPARKAEEAKREKAARDEEAQRANDMRWLMSSPQGRRVVYRLLASCGVEGKTFSESHAVSSWLEGRRSIGCELKAELCQRDQVLVLTMIREAFDAANA